MNDRSSVSFWLGLPLVLALVFFNRPAAQIAIGPVYLFDVLLAISITCSAMTSVFVLRRPALAVVLIVAVAWLTYDLTVLSGVGSPSLTLRRFAVAIYMLTPIVVFIYGRTIWRLFNAYPASSTGALLAFQWMMVTNGGAPIVAAVLLAALAITRLSISGQLDANVLIFLSGSLLISSGLGLGEGMYRTPFLALASGLACVYLLHPTLSARFAGRGGRFALISAAIFIGMVAIATIPELARGIDGIVHWRDYIDTPELIGGGGARARGDAGGTIATRIAFWNSIIQNALQDSTAMFIGNGHSLSFFDRLKPLEDFVDPERLEPHNSYLGLFYRYGLVGLIGFLLYASSFVRQGLASGRADFRCAQWSCAVVAAMYAFFEVALEGPFGAFTFWFCLLLPQVVFAEIADAAAAEATFGEGLAL